MKEITYRSDVVVELDDWMGSDATVANTARVTPPSKAVEGSSGRELGLLNMLMRDRHGTPWESVVFRFYIEAPIFVARESHRHRLSSINEESGRYKELAPVFYLPDGERALIQKGKPGAYVFELGDERQALLTHDTIKSACKAAYGRYELLLADGVAREVARMVLPVNIYTSWFLTINLRSLFNFLSLRNKTDATTVPTFPQREIEMVAEKMEALAEKAVPHCMRLFNDHGRVSP